MAPTTTTPVRHRPVPTLVAPAAAWTPAVEASHRLAPGAPVDEALVAAADPDRVLPAVVRAALAAFLDDAGPAGSLLLQGVPTGRVPRTPALPTTPTDKGRLSELVLLAVARSLGEPVGFTPEHGGALVQNLVPVRATAATQTSTSSSVDLEFHTETAFHPHRPHVLLLACLRGDPAARTFLCSVRELLPELDDRTRRVLGEPRFRTRVDESFGGTSDMEPGPPAPVLRGDPDSPTLVFDAELMTAVDAEAAEALARLRELALARRLAVVLEPGDLLVVDNHTCIHGRSAYAPRYDGTDRWLQRSFVVDDLAASAADRRGRIIDTAFA